MFLLAITFAVDEPAKAQAQIEPQEGGCWTCYAASPNSCSATSTCGMSLCKDATGSCNPDGTLCEAVPNGCW